jgi:hypothetical protein
MGLALLDRSGEEEGREVMEPHEMKALLSKIGFAGMLRAIAAWSEGERPKHNDESHPGRTWVIELAGRTIPYRPLVALASEMCGECKLDPKSFGGLNDVLCKRWFKMEKFTVIE